MLLVYPQIKPAMTTI